MLNAEVVRQKLLDEASIRAHLRIEPPEPPETTAGFRSSFLALKMEDGLYQIQPGGVRMGGPLPNATPFSVELQWPKMAPPASYTVRVLECRERAVIGETTVPLEVVKVGFAESLAAMANEQAMFYGVAAVLAAALAGFAIDFLAATLFGRKHRVTH
jgi:hypothetical protein